MIGRKILQKGETELKIETIPAKNILFKAKNPEGWFGAAFNMNIYRGCSHGCIYCDSRSDCYHLDDFDHIKVKENALELLRNDLRRKRQSGVVATGAMSDPYNPLEAELELTRGAMKLVDTYEFGVAIDTKSPLITRDNDIFQRIKSHSPVLVKMTITTFDDDLCRKIEPAVSVSSERFKAIEKLAESGIYSGVLMMPILPFINDTEKNVLQIVQRSKDSGAKFIYPAFGVTMRPGNREFFYNQLDTFFPTIKERYVDKYGYRYQCTAPDAKRLWYSFKNACEKTGLLYKMDEIILAYKSGYGSRQLSFFD